MDHQTSHLVTSMGSRPVGHSAISHQQQQQQQQQQQKQQAYMQHFGHPNLARQPTSETAPFASHHVNGAAKPTTTSLYGPQTHSPLSQGPSPSLNFKQQSYQNQQKTLLQEQMQQQKTQLQQNHPNTQMQTQPSREEATNSMSLSKSPEQSQTNYDTTAEGSKGNATRENHSNENDHQNSQQHHVRKSNQMRNRSRSVSNPRVPETQNASSRIYQVQKENRHRFHRHPQKDMAVRHRSRRGSLRQAKETSDDRNFARNKGASCSASRSVYSSSHKDNKRDSHRSRKNTTKGKSSPISSNTGSLSARGREELNSNTHSRRRTPRAGRGGTAKPNKNNDNEEDNDVDSDDETLRQFEERKESALDQYHEELNDTLDSLHDQGWDPPDYFDRNKATINQKKRQIIKGRQEIRTRSFINSTQKVANVVTSLGSLLSTHVNGKMVDLPAGFGLDAKKLRRIRLAHQQATEVDPITECAIDMISPLVLDLMESTTREVVATAANQWKVGGSNARGPAHPPPPLPLPLPSPTPSSTSYFYGNNISPSISSTNPSFSANSYPQPQPQPIATPLSNGGYPMATASPPFWYPNNINPTTSASLSFGMGAHNAGLTNSFPCPPGAYPALPTVVNGQLTGGGYNYNHNNNPTGLYTTYNYPSFTGPAGSFPSSSASASVGSFGVAPMNMTTTEKSLPRSTPRSLSSHSRETVHNISSTNLPHHTMMNPTTTSQIPSQTQNIENKWGDQRPMAHSSMTSVPPVSVSLTSSSSSSSCSSSAVATSSSASSSSGDDTPSPYASHPSPFTAAGPQYYHQIPQSSAFTSSALPTTHPVSYRNTNMMEIPNAPSPPFDPRHLGR